MPIGSTAGLEKRARTLGRDGTAPAISIIVLHSSRRNVRGTRFREPSVVRDRLPA